MFTGIIEEKSPVIHIEPGPQSLGLRVARPPSFDDIKTGDSVACNGVCLTLEAFRYPSDGLCHRF